MNPQKIAAALSEAPVQDMGSSSSSSMPSNSLQDFDAAAEEDAKLAGDREDQEDFLANWFASDPSSSEGSFNHLW